MHNDYMNDDRVIYKYCHFSDIFSKQTKLINVDIHSADITNLPTLIKNKNISRLDARSCQITNVPRVMFAENMINENIIISLVGNSFFDIAADTLLNLPAGTTINMDDQVGSYCKIL